MNLNERLKLFQQALIDSIDNLIEKITCLKICLQKLVKICAYITGKLKLKFHC